MPPHIAATDPEATVPPAAPAEQATLPPAGAALTLEHSASAIIPRCGIAVPGYEILGVLGRGGMGVVYQARQTKLDRVVALKMILAGGHAGEADLARFKTEAESVARLQHPHIVQIFEVGEHGGLPFFSLEYCPGGSLDKKLNGTPLPPKEAAALVEKLARAMQAAHDKGVVHRDLKPANVLLADDGEPKITDFGLAKKLDADAGQTRTGAVMGTPSYMAPEQAGGKKDVGPAADTYALGAILYECLTGRPPFKAATALDTIMQVAADEPVPPRQLQRTTPRDLETVCLKCLQKEPSKRYASAAALADDLRAFQAGEPIRARPVAALERAAKWVRRQPAVAGLLALVVLSLLAGTCVSTYFALVANDRVVQVEAGSRAVKAEQKKTTAALEQAELALAAGLFRPLGRQRGPLGPVERDALWEMAGLPQDRERVRVLFLDRALATPESGERLERRSALAVHAAVGLDARRRDEYLNRLLPLLRDRTRDLRLRAACAAAIVELTPPDQKAADDSMETLLEATVQVSDPGALREFADHVTILSGRLSDNEAGAAAFRLLDAMSAMPGVDDEGCRIAAFMAVASRLHAAKAAKAAMARTLDRLARSEDNGFMVDSLATQVAKLAIRMDGPAAAAAAKCIVDVMARKSRRYVKKSLAEALVALAARMDEVAAHEVVKTALGYVLDASLAAPQPGRAAENYLPVLQVLAPRLDEEAAAEGAQRIYAATADLDNSIQKDAATEWRIAPLLAPLAPHLSGKSAANTTAVALKMMENQGNPDTETYLAKAVADLAPRMGGAGRQAATTAADLIKLNEFHFQVSPLLYSLQGKIEALAALLPTMDETEARNTGRETAELALKAMDATPNQDARNIYTQALITLAPSLDKATASRVARRLLDETGKTTDANALSYLTHGLVVYAARKDGSVSDEEVAAAGGRLLAAIHGPFYEGSAGAAELAPRMDEATARSAAGRIVDDAVKQYPHPSRLADFSVVMAALASRLDAPRAEAASVLLFEANPGGLPGWSVPDVAKKSEQVGAFRALSDRIPWRRLVVLLKHPACVEPARSVLLKQLGSQLNHPFADQWELVNWLKANAPDVDVLTPPELVQP